MPAETRWERSTERSRTIHGTQRTLCSLPLTGSFVPSLNVLYTQQTQFIVSPWMLSACFSQDPCEVRISASNRREALFLFSFLIYRWEKGPPPPLHLETSGLSFPPWTPPSILVTNLFLWSIGSSHRWDTLATENNVAACIPPWENKCSCHTQVRQQSLFF